MNKKAIAPLWITLIVIAILGTGATILEANDVINIIPNKYVSLEPTNLDGYMPEIEDLSNFGDVGCRFENELLVCGGGATQDNLYDMIAFKEVDDCRQEVIDSGLYFNGRKYKNVLISQELVNGDVKNDGSNELICSDNNKIVIQIGNILGESVCTNNGWFCEVKPSVTNAYIDTYYEKRGI